MSITIRKSDLDAMEKRQRTNLINSVSGYKSANLLGTVAEAGQTNLALMSSVFHVGANPATVGLLMRPHSVPRHSLENILEQGSFTLNMVTRDIHAQSHQTSARYPREESEFAAVGLDEEYSEVIGAPYVAQSPIKTGVILLETHKIAVNETVLVVGEIVEIRLNQGLMAKDGQLRLNAAQVVAISGLDEYHMADSLGRLPYPKP